MMRSAMIRFGRTSGGEFSWFAIVPVWPRILHRNVLLISGVSFSHPENLGFRTRSRNVDICTYVTAWDVATVKCLSVLPLPLERRPERGSKNGYVRVREQARVQVEGRVQAKPIYEVFELNKEHGFCGLPEPSPGDVFFDLEGDPFVGRGGREYLFGFASDDANGTPVYECRWAITAEEEKQAFEWFVDRMISYRSTHRESLLDLRTC